MKNFPYVIIYNAVSLDGRIDNFSLDIGYYYELAGRWQHDAILVGSNTILTDRTPDPENIPPDAPETVHEDPRPLMVVPDSRGRIRNWLYLRQQPYWKDVLVLLSRNTPEEYVDHLQERQIDFIVAGEERVDFAIAFKILKESYGIKTIRVDSGGTLNGVLLQAGLVDEISVLLHPVLVGGANLSSIFQTTGAGAIPEAIKIQLIQLEKTKNDTVWLRYRVI